MSRIKEGPAGYELRYRSGEYSAAKWLFMCLTSGRSFFDGPNFREFAERARVRINEIKYPVRVGFGSAGMQYDWNSIEDVYAFANEFTGDMFEFGAWLKQYVSEKSEGGRELLRAEAESKRDQMNREREEWQGKRDAGMTPEQVAEEAGVDRATVFRRTAKSESQKSLSNEKVRQPKPASVRVNARQIYVPLDPEAAAQKLVQKFGLGFMADVSQRITKVFEAD